MIALTRAVAPVVIAIARAGAVSYFLLPDIEKRVLFSLQKWIVVAFLVNLSIIFAGTLELYFHEDGSTHARMPRVVKCLILACLAACLLDVVNWWYFAKTDCANFRELKCSLALPKRIGFAEKISLAVFICFTLLDWLAWRARPSRTIGTQSCVTATIVSFFTAFG